MYSTNAATRQAVVKFEFNATEDNQLTISKGEEVELVGEVTAEGWVLARKSNGDEGYIPDKYFDITSARTSPNRPGAPPPLPTNFGGNNSGGGVASAGVSAAATPNSRVQTMGKFSNQSRGGSGSGSGAGLLKQGDEYGVFAYQYEWFSILLLYICGILSFLYSTTLADTIRVWFILINIVSLLLTTINMCVISTMRNTCNICGCGTIGIRIILYIMNGLLLISTPVGNTCVLIAFLAVIIEINVIRKSLNELPNDYIDNWYKDLFCGICGNNQCTMGKLITFFVILAVNIACLGYGFVDGYNLAIDTTEDVSTVYYLNPEITGLMIGFGRIITITLIFILIASLFGCYSRQVRNIQAKNKQDSLCARCLDSFYTDIENRRYLHKLFGYFIGIAAIFHVIFAYWVYEDSSSTHSFYDIYGWWILVTGGLALLLLTVIVATSDETILEQSPKLFNVGHRFVNGLLIIVLIIHGSMTNIVSQYFWIFIVAPFTIYICDALYRYARQDD